MKKRKPNSYERESLYMGAKEYALKVAGDPYTAALQYLQGVDWLHPRSADGIAAKVTERVVQLRTTGQKLDG